ncbi:MULTISPECIES: anti-sigma factor [unclassified Streptomyces]|uniref:anti-sigma factor n=1 Tax=unclassified Streptomyces TaxID=2593676 RepID=UPI002E283CA3|nr:anti-sigma factor [Streptomyces sp. NBC_00223]
MTIAELHTLTGAYAVHALTGPEREEFERHLAECSACAREVDEFTATASRLGMAVSAVPPARMREQVLIRIGAVRQEPPLVTSRQELPDPAARSTGARRLSRYALAACLAAAVGFGGVAVWQHRTATDAGQRAQRAEQRATDLSQVLAAPDAVSTTRRTGAGATTTVVVSWSLGKAAFLASGMPALSGGRMYELWFDDAGTMRPAGLMDPAVSDQAVVLDGRVGVASAMGVTVEPAGGSAHPTGDPVALLTFPAGHG